MVLSPSGEVYVAGQSSSFDFPATSGGAQAAEPIPTLDEWGLMRLTLALGGAGVLLLRRLWA